MMENLYAQGSVVFAKEAPTKKLTVRRYAKRVYYCIVQDNPTQKELVYYERELTGGATSPAV
ncbi:hypothetical protein ACD591_00440 [Rufibacter glacialis]|uniref:Uncharacterized protein n=1 Tax=Rufibacter glacialis TaxID=1259555 RepID=A0A5M8QH60_9BACT|nr:hypothetical protein [Rufibacter glacialis]KAA6435379.1 hypothetical protein FOE74_05355 [Rufibacter glacialis]GGK62916.1 hypothetical protein GCM10011405_08700 [Rufibacter glacialis]